MTDPQKLAEEQAVDLFDAVRSQAINDISVSEYVWKNTKNPVYVWQAISLCFRIEAERKRILQGVRPSMPLGVAHPFPSWCMEYLHHAAFRINVLANAVAEGDITGTQAREKLPVEIGFTQGTSNAFDKAKAYQELRLDDLSIAALNDTLSEQAAMETAAEEAGLSDARAMRKRRSKFLEVFAGTTEAAPKRRAKKR